MYPNQAPYDNTEEKRFAGYPADLGKEDRDRISRMEEAPDASEADWGRTEDRDGETLPSMHPLKFGVLFETPRPGMTQNRLRIFSRFHESPSTEICARCSARGSVLIGSKNMPGS